MPPAERTRRRQRRRASTVRLAVTATGLWAAVALMAVLSLLRERAALRRELAELSEPLAAFERAQREVDAGRAMLSALEVTSESQSSFALRIVAVAHALPDSAYLSSLTLGENGGGSITGVARRAAQVMANLEAEPLIGNVRMEGSSVREVVQGKDWERFEIALGRRPAL